MNIFEQNFTFEFNPKIDVAMFVTKINYLVKRIISNYHTFSFSTKTISNIKSSTIFSNNKGKVDIGHNSSNEICKTIEQFEFNLQNFFELIHQTSESSKLYIEFIDLTIRLYRF